MVRRPLRYVGVALFALTGCSALLDVKDIYFERPASTADGGADGNATEGGSADGGTDSAPCAADTAKDPLNCGRCGHSCLGGTCTAGVCQAYELTSVTDAPLAHIAVTDQHVFFSSRISLTTEAGGLWRAPKSGGAAELYSSFRYAAAMVAVGDTLYFVVKDDPNDGTPGQTGGLYSCPLVGPAPCVHTLIAPATVPSSITVDKGRILYGDDGPSKGLMAYVPPAAPKVFRAGFGFAPSFFVDGESAFYGVTFFQPLPTRAKLLEILTDGGVAEAFAYDNPYASAGRVIGDTSSLLFTAYDYKTTTGGVLRRLPRTGAVPCSVGGSLNKRPFAIYEDTARIYWTNLGDGPDEPYTNGSVASCEQAGCCTTPTVLWTGDGEPYAIAGDGDAVYFVTYTKGSVWRVAKP